ncbi:hypothetical protein [Ralstonia pseudosolanacearum]|uniref:hypothetical protein n=1 Tax=Ralstonia pseudosolanacearum TaxID=1310165 RepID=UPI001865FFC0|nr:hypothetical protein [Ralstonia pseudosolanacearum]
MGKRQENIGHAVGSGPAHVARGANLEQPFRFSEGAKFRVRVPNPENEESQHEAGFPNWVVMWTNKPPPSNSLIGLSEGLALRIAMWVSGAIGCTLRNTPTYPRISMHLIGQRWKEKTREALSFREFLDFQGTHRKCIWWVVQGLNL